MTRIDRDPGVDIVARLLAATTRKAKPDMPRLHMSAITQLQALLPIAAYGQLFSLLSGKYICRHAFPPRERLIVDRPKKIEYTQHIERRPRSPQRDLALPALPLLVDTQTACRGRGIIAGMREEQLIPAVASPLVGTPDITVRAEVTSTHIGDQRVTHTKNPIRPRSGLRSEPQPVVIAISTQRKHGRAGLFVDKPPFVGDHIMQRLVSQSCRPGISRRTDPDQCNRQPYKKSGKSFHTSITFLLPILPTDADT